jgi:uncharacterized membrane protein YidH (DUF202 family)
MGFVSFAGSIIAAVLCIGTITVMAAMAWAFLAELLQEARGLRPKTSALNRLIGIGAVIFFLACAFAAALYLSVVISDLRA